MIKENLVLYFENSLKSNWEKPAFSDYKGSTLRYFEVAQIIARYHILFEKLEIKPGDKIALLGKNSSNWAVIYLAIVAYGAVIVPILPEFKPGDIQNIIICGEGVFVRNVTWQPRLNGNKNSKAQP